MTIELDGLIRRPGQGISYWFDRDLYRFKAMDKYTGEAYALCEVIVARQYGIESIPPPSAEKA
jgi:hypothetical protein